MSIVRNQNRNARREDRGDDAPRKKLVHVSSQTPERLVCKEYVPV